MFLVKVKFIIVIMIQFILLIVKIDPIFTLFVLLINMVPSIPYLGTHTLTPFFLQFIITPVAVSSSD